VEINSSPPDSALIDNPCHAIAGAFSRALRGDDAIVIAESRFLS